jgi:DNA-binding PadR family transcriptional regulator
MSQVEPNLPQGNVNPTQASLLGFLHGGPKTGWDLLTEVSRGLSRFWNVTSSHVYRELKTLEARGLITAGPTGPRDKRPYTITDAGRDAFAAWLREEPGAEQVRVPLLVTLWFGKHLDDATLAGFIESHRAMHEARLAEYRAIAGLASEHDPHVAAVVDFGIAYEEAFLNWLGSLGY